MISLKHSSSHGFSLIELLMVITLIGILSTTSISLINESMQEAAFDSTVSELSAIKHALIGNTELTTGGKRDDFGLIGDTGSPPTNAQGLGVLTTRPPSITAWAIDPALRLGSGWNGPYLKSLALGDSPLKDGWNNDYIYDYNETTKTITLSSLGADGTVGGSGFDSDIIVSILSEDYRSTVFGQITQDSSIYDGNAEVELYQPDGTGGILTTLLSVPAAAQGYFTFNDISMGKKTIKVYIPSKINPLSVLGPAIITIDRPNYLIPHETFNKSVEESVFPFCISSQILTYRAGTASINKERLTIRVDISNSIIISAIGHDLNPTSNILQFKLGNKTADCDGPFVLTPCPMTEDSNSDITPTYDHSIASNRTLQISFADDIPSGAQLFLYFRHSLGCEVLTIDDIL